MFFSVGFANSAQSLSGEGQDGFGRLCESGASEPVARMILLFGGDQKIPWSRQELAAGREFDSGGKDTDDAKTNTMENNAK